MIEREKVMNRSIEAYKGKNLIGSFLLTENIITIGRAGDNDIVLPDKKLQVSRYHAVLIKNCHDEHGGYLIRDLSSAWGTRNRRRHIFQKALDEGDVIQIADFQLKYQVSKEDNKAFFRITDEFPDAFSSPVPSAVGSENTITRRLPYSAESAVAPELPEEQRMLFDEFLYQVKNSDDLCAVLQSAIDLLFIALNMKGGCLGCFMLFEGENRMRCLAGKGMAGRAAVPLPRQAIEDLKKGNPVIFTNQLCMPIFQQEKAVAGFLYLGRGPYGTHFQEKEITLASHISQIAAKAMKGGGNAPFGEVPIKWPQEMIGSQQILREIKRIAPLEIDVLILGETGVGKDIAAEEIHRQSSRRDKILRKINCAAIPKGLVESTLFGHKRGAFTGATEDKKGEFELAEEGALFLDEIADLPWASQRKLLRAIQSKEIKRLGEERNKPINVRIIAATNRDLRKDMENGQFGSDLYYRFGERIFIPPLRNRLKDIPLLAHYFLDGFALQEHIRQRGITPQAMRCFLTYPWPGNTRELKDCIGKTLSKSKGIIFSHHLPDNIKNYGKYDYSEPKAGREAPNSLDEIKRVHIMETLQYTRGKKERACQILKISKQTLYNMMDKLKIPRSFGKG